MTTWTVTITDADGTRVVSGVAEDEAAARTAGAGAAHDWAIRAGREGRPGCRYCINVDASIAAVVVTGLDDLAGPAHQEAAAVLAPLYGAPPTEVGLPWSSEIEQAWPTAEIALIPWQPAALIGERQS